MYFKARPPLPPQKSILSQVGSGKLAAELTVDSGHYNRIGKEKDSPALG